MLFTRCRAPPLASARAGDAAIGVDPRRRAAIRVGAPPFASTRAGAPGRKLGRSGWVSKLSPLTTHAGFALLESSPD